ncbi:MAG: T9SS type A sorting domain-containing protein [Bacteroidetes bacterium]|nr:MAG: T9SS type A sorting domain-containing protein [Bacteroidota bacterium]
MKRVLFIIILLIALAFQYAKSQKESGWIDKGNYLENKFITSQYSYVNFSPDDKSILSYSNDKILRKWDTETGTLLKEIKMADYQFNMYDISTDNKYFAYNYRSVDNIDSLFIFDIENKNIKCQLGTYSNYEPWGSVDMNNKFIKFNPTTNCVLLSSETNYNRFGAYQTGIIGDYFECCFDSCEHNFLKPDIVPYKFEYSPDGKKYAICGYTEYTTSRDYFNYYKHEFNYYFELVNTLLSDTDFILDCFSTESEYAKPNTPDYFLFTPDSKYLAVFEDNKIKFWDTETGELSMVADNFYFSGYYNDRIIFSKDMKYLIKWENNNKNLIIHFIHLKDTESSESLVINDVNATCFDLSNDSSFVIGTSDGRLILIKDIYSNISKFTNQSKINLIYPNPAKDKVSINYSLSNDSHVNLTLYNFMGKEIITLVDENKTVNDYVENINTGFLAEGMYFLKLQTGTSTSLFKLMINR